MRKNRMMRLASVLLILTMVTTCAISGTFAKYTTSAEASDTARVAKWGVVVNASGSLFGSDYESNSAAENKDSIVVTSTNVSGSENVVAPGTKNETGMTFQVIGQPEVANTVTFAKSNSTKFEDIYLKTGDYGVLVKADGVTADNYANYYVEGTPAGTYAKATSYSSTATYYVLRDKADVTADYYPVIWYIDDSEATSKTTADLYTEFAGKFSSITAGTNVANANIADSHKITWEWKFFVDAATDAADTILGNLMAGGADYVVVKTADDYVNCTKVVEDTDYNLNVYFDAKITVTQVD